MDGLSGGGTSGDGEDAGRRYRVVDVFTERRFGGNPLAVVLDADGLDAATMQAVAREFGFSETTFVLPPRDPAHDAWVRIFTPEAELPFAGHPNVGTAFVLARLAGDAPARFVFGEGAGPVAVEVLREDGAVAGARLTAPARLSTGVRRDAATVARAAGLAPEDVALGRHPPVVASAGLPFLVVELASRAALSRVAPERGALTALMRESGAEGVYLYARETTPEDGGADWSARMVAPLGGHLEDPATGSATVAAAALFASLEPALVGRRRVAAQGVDMGRPSRLEADVDASGLARVGGRCVSVMAGRLEV